MRKLSAMKVLSQLAITLLALSTTAQNITTPRTPSPAATVSQTIGISTVTVNYSRPSVKSRAVWGALVPYGWNVQQFGAGNSAPWRAGANENTVIRFSHPVKLEGQTVPAGDYGLFFVINKDNTGQVILSKDSRSWGSFFYDQKMDQLRADIKLRDNSYTELLTYDFVNLTKNTGELVLNWEKKQFPVKLEYDVDNIVIENATEELKGPTGFNFQGYASAANYALQNNTNLDQALVWADKAMTMNKTFATESIKANILTALGKKDEADKLMTDALSIANEAQINQYGYNFLLAGNTDKAIEVFVLNTKRYPASPNAWDSLGEGYFNKKDKKNATASFKKALSLNPPANVKANSEKFMQQLATM
jgi:tetratricopeptide (TPR) repeat protein